jgi:hypothetical protein
MLFAVPLAIALAGAATSVHAAGAGLELNTRAEPTEVELPVYPGARLRADRGDDGPAMKFAIWGGPLGFRMALAQYRSSDPVEDVAAFYRRALAREGTVLDCSGPRPAEPAPADDRVLRCNDGERAEAGGRLYKAGTRERQKVVSLKTVGNVVEIDLLRLEVRH